MRRFVLVVSCWALAGCPRDNSKPPQADHALIAISPKLTVRTDAIGDEGKPATFVLVDADNHSTEELLVTLTGDLVDDHGAVVGHLRKDELRIPSGGRRTFALVDDHVTARASATSAKIEVDSASLPLGPSPMRITEGHVFADNGRAVAQAYVINDSDHAGKAIVIAGFYDADGKPMTRPYSVIELGAGAKQTAQFVGPPGSKTAYIFIGETAY
ncbi:MAG TPA: hypothetical protein VL463_22430 [Kofleriaceae bacterium]|nr:hypothetical protein [Kofleriaceae bacterium]